MLTRAGSAGTDPDSSTAVVPPLLVPVIKKDTDTASVTSERRVTHAKIIKEHRDDVTDDSSNGDGASFTYSEKASGTHNSSRRSRSETASSEDSDISLLEWDAAMAQLLYLFFF